MYVCVNALRIHCTKWAEYSSFGEHVDGQKRKVGPVCYMECQQAAWTLAGVDWNEGPVSQLLCFDKQIHINKIYISHSVKSRRICVGFKAFIWRQNVIGLIISVRIRECIWMERNVIALDYSVTSQATGCGTLGRFLVTVAQSCREAEQEEAANLWLC
jgi:hypothetical protein